MIITVIVAIVDSLRTMLLSDFKNVFNMVILNFFRHGSFASQSLRGRNEWKTSRCLYS